MRMNGKTNRLVSVKSCHATRSETVFYFFADPSAKIVVSDARFL